MNRIAGLIRQLRGEGVRATLARGSGAALIVHVGGVGALYGLHVALAHWLGEADYGAFAFAWSWAQVLAFLAGVGLPMAALRYVPEYLAAGDTHRLRGLLVGGGIITLAVGLLVVAAGGGLVVFIHPRDWPVSTLLLGLGAAPLLAMIWFQRDMTRGVRRMVVSLAPAKLLHPLLTLALCGGGLLWLEKLTSADAMLALLGAGGVVLVVQRVILRRVYASRFREARPARFDLRGWIGLALPLLVVQQSVVLLNQGDLLMIGLYLDPQHVGVYNAAARTAMVAVLVDRGVKMMAAPMLASLFYEHRPEALAQMVRSATRWMFFSSLGVGLVVIAAAPWLLMIFGPRFTSAATALRLLVLGQVIGTAAGPAGQMLNLLGHQRRSAVLFGSAAVVNLGLNAAAIPLMGIEGAALATALSLAARNLWCYRLVRKHVHPHRFIFGLGGKSDDRIPPSSPTPASEPGDPAPHA